MKRKELMAAVQQRWPDASKKKIRRAAFRALIRTADDHTEKTPQHHRDGLEAQSSH